MVTTHEFLSYSTGGETQDRLGFVFDVVAGFGFVCFEVFLFCFLSFETRSYM